MDVLHAVRDKLIEWQDVFSRHAFSSDSEMIQATFARNLYFQSHILRFLSGYAMKLPLTKHYFNPYLHANKCSRNIYKKC